MREQTVNLEIHLTLKVFGFALKFLMLIFAIIFQRGNRKEPRRDENMKGQLS